MTIAINSVSKYNCVAFTYSYGLYALFSKSSNFHFTAKETCAIFSFH